MSNISRDGEFVFELVQSGIGLVEGFTKLIEFCQTHYPKRDWQRIGAINLETDTQAMVKWLTDLLTNEPPPDAIAAYYFGLYNPVVEDEVTCGFYVSGSTQFSVEGSDWAVWREDSYIPAGRYAPQNNLNRLYTVWDDIEYDNDSPDPDQHSDSSAYVLFLGYAGLLTFELCHRVPPNLWLGQAAERVVAVGWDSGDLIEVGTVRPTGFERWQSQI